MPRARSFRTTSGFYGYLPQGVKWLLIANTAVFLVCYLGGQPVQVPVLAFSGAQRR